VEVSGILERTPTENDSFARVVFDTKRKGGILLGSEWYT
jgi:hypothetical protein